MGEDALENVVINQEDKTMCLEILDRLVEDANKEEIQEMYDRLILTKQIEYQSHPEKLVTTLVKIEAEKLC